MPTDLNALQVFVKVVQTGSFTAGARLLGVPKSTASQRVSELEERLGARLLQRTTRKLSLTDQGRIYYDHCLRIFADIEEADFAVTSLQLRPSGVLRMTVPASTQFLGPILTDFLQRCAGVQLDVTLTDQVVDLVEESFDIALRAGPLSDSTLVARKLGMIEFMLVASPGYLKLRGRPQAPEDLTEHACLMFNTRRHARSFRLVQEEDTREIPLAPTLAVNDMDVVQDAVLGSVGIAILPAYRCTDDLRAGRLERVLPAWHVPSEPIHALYPSGRHLSKKVKSMLDHLQSATKAPWSPDVPLPDARRARRRKS